MDKFLWDQALSVKVHDMDDEHKVLINLMNDMLEEMDKKGENSLALFEKFANYTIKHFKDEEEFMEKIQFPGITTHKIMHTQLLEKVTSFKCPIEEGTLDLQGFKNFLYLWLTSHIKGIDIKYGDFSTKKVA